MDKNFVDFVLHKYGKIPESLKRYHQVFNQVIGTDGQEIEIKDKRCVWGY